MKLRIDRTRMAMRGCFYSYDCVVPLKPSDDRSYTIVRDGESYLTFADATLPAGHRDMPLGWERYEAYQAHEAIAKVKAWAHICEAFPELGITGPHSLFLEIPGFDAGHETKFVEVSL